MAELALGYAGDPVLVFCASRQQTQSAAQLLADLLPTCAGCATVSDEVQQKRQALATQLQDAMGGFSNTALEKLMLAGPFQLGCSACCDA